LAQQKKPESQNPSGLQQDSVQSVVQPISFGRLACLNYGHSGSAGTAVTAERLFWKTANLQRSFKKSGKLQKPRDKIVRNVKQFFVISALPDTSG
jgi:hypothetical protein